MTKSALIIGAGFTGLAAAYDLAKAGWNVRIVEKDAEIGGLAGTFELAPGYRIEKFYHHWFSSDTDILSWLKELDIGDLICFRPTNTGLYYANSVFRLASPLDLLRFKPLPVIDRVRVGMMALLARRVRDWSKLEDQSAEEWIIKLAGRVSYETIWKPLLAGKFGIEAPNISAVWFWNKLKLRGSSRDSKGNEQLAYIDGGFNAALVRIREVLQSLGVKVDLNTTMDKITGDEADAVLATVPLPTFLRLTPSLPKSYVDKASQIRFLGNVCLVLRLRQSLSHTYWLNVADPTFPFVGIIEHTNFDPPEKYGGEHIAYISKYMPTSDPLYKMSDSHFFEFALPFIKKIFPSFTKDWIIDFKTWRAEFSQPVIVKNYSSLVPSSKTPLKNVWLSTMAQIYPEDRGTNYAVRQGRAVAQEILSH